MWTAEFPHFDFYFYSFALNNMEPIPKFASTKIQAMNSLEFP